MKTKLHRSQKDQILGGVCGGLGAYLAIDPVLVRLFFVALALADGIGVLLYLVLWVVVPKAEVTEEALGEPLQGGAGELSDRARAAGAEIQQAATERDPRLFNWIGGTLVFLGAYFLLRNLNIPWLFWLDLNLLWPLLLIAAGILLVARRGQFANE